MLVVGVTVVVAATVVGVTLAATASATLEQELSSRYFREIVVTATARSWDAPAWKTLPQRGAEVPDRALVGEARAQVAAYFDATHGDGALNVTDPRAEARAIADRYRCLVRVILFLALSATEPSMLLTQSDHKHYHYT